jgi:DNA-binding Lrp family transcriptional regulator
MGAGLLPCQRGAACPGSAVATARVGWSAVVFKLERMALIFKAAHDPAGKRSRGSCLEEMRVIPFFVQIKCHLGKSYSVANALADAEIASEIYSTAGDFDLLVKFYVEQGTDIGHFVNEKVQTISGIQDTRTIITFKAF